MCFTGGFALAMMVDTSVVAPVLAQPSLPFPVGKKRAADLNLSPADLAAVRERAAGGCQVLGLRYRKDAAVGTRFDTLTSEIGDAFIRVEFDGKGHSTLTEHRQQEGVDRVLAFFGEKLTSSRLLHSTAVVLDHPIGDRLRFDGPESRSTLRPRGPARSWGRRCRR